MRRALFVTMLALGIAAPARAEYEVGGLVGIHVFSSTSALGRDASSMPGTALAPASQFGIRLLWLPRARLGAELELDAMPTHTQDDSASTMVFGVHAHALFHFLTHERIRPFAILGIAGMLTSSSDPLIISNDVQPALEAGVGIKIEMASWWGVRIDGRALVLPSIFEKHYASDFSLVVGIIGRFPAPPPLPVVLDRDNDGTIDSMDHCPDVPGPVRNFGCPLDRDKDGIPDDNDQCPDQPGTKADNGCPADRDGDGVMNRDDLCPTVKGPAENHGCPDTDTDKDGVVDRLDKCPNEPGPKENEGCPDKDTDGDKIVDRLDKCPTQPETYNGYQDEDGCPDEVPQKIRDYTGIREEINFHKGTATLTVESTPSLEKAAAVLKEYPDVKLEISGHTDDTGTRTANLRISLSRAEAVKKYFIDHGISADRLTAVGYGPDHPISDNSTDAGRTKNRRVEFKLVSATAEEKAR